MIPTFLLYFHISITACQIFRIFYFLHYSKRLLQNYNTIHYIYCITTWCTRPTNHHPRGIDAGLLLLIINFTQYFFLDNLFISNIVRPNLDKLWATTCAKLSNVLADLHTRKQFGSFNFRHHIYHDVGNMVCSLHILKFLEYCYANRPSFLFSHFYYCTRTG